MQTTYNYSRKQELYKKLVGAAIYASSKGKIKLRLGGHNRFKFRKNITMANEQYVEQLVKHPLSMSQYKFTEEEFEEVITAIVEGKPCNPIELEGTFLSSCMICGEKLNISFDGVTIRVLNRCKFAGGMKEFSFYIPIPSGSMSIHNDFRPLYNKDSVPTYCSSIADERKITELYAKQGLAYGFLGDSDPDIFRIGDDKVTISNFMNEEPVGENVGSIVTDNWWYSMADYDDICERVGMDVKKVRYISTFNVKKGIYKVTQRTHTFDRDSNVTKHFATFEWDRDIEE